MFGARVDALKSASEAMVRSGPAFRSAYARMSVMMRRLVQGKGGARASGLAPPTPAPDDDGDEDEGNATTHQWCWKDHCEGMSVLFRIVLTLSTEYFNR